MLRENTSLRAALLAGEREGQRLVQLLTEKITRAVPRRLTFKVNDIVGEIREARIELQAPPDVNPQDLSELAVSAIAVLQSCCGMLPLDVLAKAVNSDAERVRSELSPLIGGVILLDGDLVSVGPMPSRFGTRVAAESTRKALESLLAFVTVHEHDAQGVRQVENVVSLATRCATEHMETVALAFPALDHLLKRQGNKHAVLSLAKLSVDAARRVPTPRSRSVVEAEARSLICGISWVYQRLGRLDKAMVAAEESRKLSERGGLELNLAYCAKCLGRLRRMEAEGVQDPQRRTSLLHESVALLEEAIERFSQIPGIGPTDPKVGDCYSLLARTYLESRQLNKAHRQIAQAYRLITDEKDKDYIDLVILSGDLAIASDRQEAGHYYDQALRLCDGEDAQVTEMLARTLLKRGNNAAAMGKTQEAVWDLTRAAETWRKLGEEESAAEATWQVILLTRELSYNDIKCFEAEPPIVRVNAISLHDQQLAQYTGKRTARRSKVDSSYWKQRLKDASQRVAATVIEW